MTIAYSRGHTRLRVAEGEHLDADDEVVRHCTTAVVTEEGVPEPGAFMLAGHTYLSVSSVKIAAPGLANRTEQLRAVKAAMSLGRTIRNSHRLAVISAARIRSIQELGDDLVEFTILHHPDKNPAHCGIHGITPAPSPIEELFAAELAKLHPQPAVLCGDL